MKLQSCDVMPILALGAIADALFLGFMGMLTSALTGNTVIGYMPPLLYYALNIGMGPKLGSLYLFSMVTGSYTAKLWLFLAGLLMMAAASRSNQSIFLCSLLPYTDIGKLRATSKPPYSLCFISIFPLCTNMICLTMSSPKPWRCSVVFSSHTI